MSTNILPMTKNEITNLYRVMNLLKQEYKNSIGADSDPGGFASAFVLNFDNDIIVIQVKYGGTASIGDQSFKEQVKINRHTMMVEEKMLME